MSGPHESTHDRGEACPNSDRFRCRNVPSPSWCVRILMRSLWRASVSPVVFHWPIRVARRSRDVSTRLVNCGSIVSASSGSDRSGHSPGMPQGWPSAGVLGRARRASRNLSTEAVETATGAGVISFFDLNICAANWLECHQARKLPRKNETFTNHSVVTCAYFSMSSRQVGCDVAIIPQKWRRVVARCVQSLLRLQPTVGCGFAALEPGRGAD